MGREKPILGFEMKRLLGLLAIMLGIYSSVASAQFAYVANAGSNTVSVINTSTNTVTATVPVGAFPDGVAIRRAAAPIVTPAQVTDCQGRKWQTVRRADGSAFRNQGDCIQYVNTGK